MCRLSSSNDSFKPLHLYSLHLAQFFFPVCVSNSLLFTLDLDAFNLLIFKTMFHHPQLLKDSDFSFHLIWMFYYFIEMPLFYLIHVHIKILLMPSDWWKIFFCLLIHVFF